ncbi:hypothetical protein TIFTF001_024925 [Ficus carica]|uniref:3-oxo-5-alpha-steroid 4-dehydrogenase C-terminal domain-containing protein n=1 Tax=Ficus carica TaxID=3494 RepID=A0AA88DH27_FICCA|nr:hypothetical protein TIFTF001_024925 [Ficus carica]
MELSLVGLLRAGWVAAILPILIASLPFSWMTSFHGLVLGFAKRGKIMQASKSFSSDAYYWLPNWPLVSFYIAAPLSLCCNCTPDVYKFVLNGVAEFIVKGKSRMPSLEFDWWEFTIPLVKLGWFQRIGAAIFFYGWIHQRRCHAILGSLRERREQADEYVIPHGDWFRIVSSPHYLAEIVLYFGLLVASGGTDLTIWLLFIFVVANLVLAAAETHRWYRRKFENYPTNRRAVIPFVY